MPLLLDVCHEILHDIFVNVEPADLGRLSQTCKPFNSFIKGNRILWRDMYLGNYVRLYLKKKVSWHLVLLTCGKDEPPAKVMKDETDWEQEVPRIVNLQKILESEDLPLKVSDVQLYTSVYHTAY